jgi:transposase
MSKLFIGIDWSQSHYDIAVVANKGAILTQFHIPKSQAGFEKLAEKIDQFDVPRTDCLIGLETAHNILIDFLWSQQFPVYVVAPSIVNSSRGRYGSSGAYSDQTDARLIADLLRTDRVRFAPWRPDGELLTTIKMELSFVDHLTKQLVQQTNRLRAILLRIYPQIVHVFPQLNTRIAMHILLTYPTPQQLTTLTHDEFAAFCRQHHCLRRDWISKWYTGLMHPQPEASTTLINAYQAEMRFQAQMLLRLGRQKEEMTEKVQTLFQQHPDQAIFASLPGAGDLLQPKLLLMFGEDRERFPDPQDIRTLAGTCPVTKQSGKSRRIHYRRACNRDYRHTAQQFAIASVKQSDWAATYYHNVLARSHRKNHAYRCLANRWLGIIWKLWQDNQMYDESYHLKQLHKHRRILR